MIYHFISAVCRATGLTEAELFHPSRQTEFVNARGILALLIKDARPGISNANLARLLGLTDPSSGRHALQRARLLLKERTLFRMAYERAKESLEPAVKK